jgi:hypothetical protein
MFDFMLVEGIGGQIAFRRSQMELVSRLEGKQIPLFAAMGAVALHHLVDFSLHRKGDTPAVATSLVAHGNSPLVVLFGRLGDIGVGDKDGDSGRIFDVRSEGSDTGGFLRDLLRPWMAVESVQGRIYSVSRKKPPVAEPPRSR